MLAILDGTVLPADEAFIPATDEGLLRGDGVFEVIRLYAGRPFALDDHLERMERSARNLRLDLDVRAVRDDIDALLERAGDVDGVLRVVVTRGGRRLGLLEPPKELPPTLGLVTITYAPPRILDGVKSLSYAGNMLAGRLARERGGDEALLVTPHGRVLEGPTSSLFCSLDGEGLITPPLEDHILDSITRRRVLQLTGAREAAIAVDDLLDAREAFMASTVREVHPVHAIDGRPLPGDVPGPLTEAAAAAVRAHIERELDLRSTAPR
jgi:branched-subunit amino acid aminotransferase/4-amino-4-deoxychorismate lyase